MASYHSIAPLNCITKSFQVSWLQVREMNLDNSVSDFKQDYGDI